jgi:hypothetical protein
MISGDIPSFTYIVKEPGNYLYECRYAGMQGQFSVAASTGINQPLQNFLRLRSNHVDEYVTVEMPDVVNLIPSVKDITGKTVKKFEEASFSIINLYVGDLKNGIYILELTDGMRITSYRFVKY